jgi:aspartyl-tRNA(Asn)/glutamyl-tRNA(Gln) amidotransferase subunit C
MALDPATVRRIATLARIRMDDAEVTTLVGELNTIFGWIEQLNEVDITGVVNDGGYPEEILFNAPDRNGDFFAVPKVVE